VTNDGTPHDEPVDPEAWRKRFDQDRKDSKSARGNGQTEWPEPIPLTLSRDAARPYPVDALPAILRDAVLEYAEYGQQPLPLIASSALASTSLTVQGLADVARDAHLSGPSSLYSLVVAISGERKTSADNWFRSAIRTWMIACGDAMHAETVGAVAELDAWKAERDGLLAKIKTASGKAVVKDGADVKQLREDLVALERTKPDEVIVPRLFYEDVNNAALASNLASDWPSASLWSDEAGLVVGAHGMSDDTAMPFLGLLNRLWDGNTFDRDRITVPGARLRGRRFTVSLMMQPIVMERLLSVADGASRGMGFLARFLITWPVSTIGTRMYRQVEAMPAIERLHQRLRELLDMPLPIDPENPALMILAPPVLRFTARAQQLWERFHDDVETELGKTGQYVDVADIGAKVAENVARLAGNFHVLEYSPTGEIDSKTLYRAIKIVSWHLDEARRVFATFERSESVTDAELLLTWLRKQPARIPPTPINRRNILHAGPRSLRDLKRRDQAVEVLAEHLHLIPYGGIGKPRRYVLNPRSVAR
jgi:hypothetical protein